MILFWDRQVKWSDTDYGLSFSWGLISSIRSFNPLNRWLAISSLLYFHRIIVALSVKFVNGNLLNLDCYYNFNFQLPKQNNNKMKMVTKVVAYKKNVISLCCNTLLNDTTLLRDSGTNIDLKKRKRTRSPRTTSVCFSCRNLMMNMRNQG